MMGVPKSVETGSLGASLSSEASSSLEVSSSSLLSASLLPAGGLSIGRGAIFIRESGPREHLLAKKYFIRLCQG